MKREKLERLAAEAAERMEASAEKVSKSPKLRAFVKREHDRMRSDADARKEKKAG